MPVPDHLDVLSVKLYYFYLRKASQHSDNLKFSTGLSAQPANTLISKEKYLCAIKVYKI